MTDDVQNLDDLAWDAARARLAPFVFALSVDPHAADNAWSLSELYDMWYSFRWTPRETVDRFLAVLSPLAMTSFEVGVVLAFAPPCAGRDAFEQRAAAQGFCS